jgi:hypothetical protein
MENINEILCPKCGSNQVTADKKGFSGKKAVAGAVLTGGIGLLAGTIGSNKVKITCLSCGCTFKPGSDLNSIKRNQEKLAKDFNTPMFWIQGAAFFLVLFWLFKGCF